MAFKDKFISFFKDNKKIVVGIGSALLIVCLICGIAFLPKEGSDGDGSSAAPPSLSDTFGVLFNGEKPSDSSEEANGNSESTDSDSSGSGWVDTTTTRPIENDEIPFSQTKLSAAMDNLDLHYLYIQSVHGSMSSTGVIQQELLYAINGNDIYIRQVVGNMQNHFLSDGDNFYGLDFEERTYMLISSEPYKVQDLIYIDEYEYCTSTGKQIFGGEQLYYEDYTISTAPQNEWIRYYFNEDGSLAGFERYVDKVLQEIMLYEHCGSEFPDDAVIYFDIPADFTEYDNNVHWSDIVGDDTMD